MHRSYHCRLPCEGVQSSAKRCEALSRAMVGKDATKERHAGKCSVRLRAFSHAYCVHLAAEASSQEHVSTLTLRVLILTQELGLCFELVRQPAECEMSEDAELRRSRCSRGWLHLASLSLAHL